MSSTVTNTGAADSKAVRGSSTFEDRLAQGRMLERAQRRQKSGDATESDQVKGHTISLLVNNRPGVLIRVALAFARRGYNIDSLVVSPSSNEDFSVMNIDVSGDKKTLDQIIKQVNKLVDVVHATDYTDEDLIQRELALIKVKCRPEERPEVLQLAHALDCVTLDLSETTVTFQITGPTERLDNAQMVLSSYGVVEMIRTGKLIMARGEKVTS